MASVGSRLVCLRPDSCPSEIAGQRSDSLSTCDWIRTREPLSDISVAPGSGLVAAVGPSQSAIIYRYSTDEGFEIVCADPVSHSPVACLPLNRHADDALQVRTSISRTFWCLLMFQISWRMSCVHRLLDPYLSSHVGGRSGLCLCLCLCLCFCCPASLV